MTDRPYHHGDLRRALLDRALAVVDQEGADGLSLRGLARDLGVSHGASARHFRDRQALLDAIALAGFDRLGAEVTGTVTAAGPGGYRTALRTAGLAYITFAVAHPHLLDVMYGAKHHPEASAELRERSHAPMRALESVIARAQSAGEVRPGDPALLATAVFATVHGIATLATGGLLDGTPWQEAAGATLDFAWQGIATGVA